MPTFLTEPQWYDKNGNPTTVKDVKVDNASHADEADEAGRATDCFGKKYTPLNWMKNASWSSIDNVVSSDANGLLLSGDEIKMEMGSKSNTYLEVLPALLRYDVEGLPMRGYPTYVNLGRINRKFGKIYAKSFEGPASNISISEPSLVGGEREVNSYSFSLDGTTLTLTKKTT